MNKNSIKIATKNFSVSFLLVTLMLSPMSILFVNTAYAMPVSIFSDSFGSISSNDVSGLIEEEGLDEFVRVTTENPRSGSGTIGYAYLGDDGSMSITVDTGDHNNIILSYFWRGSDNEHATDADALRVYWKKSSDSNFILLNSHSTLNETDWSEVQIALPNDASNSEIDLKFFGNTAFKVAGASVDDVMVAGSIIEVPTPIINTPPTITLLGANPLNLIVGSAFVDPGATATDTEDGNLTSQIVKTGTVNASTTGSYTLTYVVKDSGNLYATTTRTVVVSVTSTPPVITHSCMLPNSLGDSTVEPIVHGWDPYSLQDIFNQLGIKKNVITDQKQYQEWNVGATTTSVRVEFLSKNADLNSTFGYYKNATSLPFSPLVSLVGQTTTFDLPAGSKIGFGIKVSNGTFYGTHNSINENNNDHAVVYELANNVYIIAFEDLPISA